MKITPAVLQQEFVGLPAEVVRSSNIHFLGVAGRVIDETRNLLVILHKNRKKAVVKNTAVFRFRLSDGTIVEVDGETIIGRPEERVKRRIRRLW
ncbi:MAG: ribonuclease P protein subunit [Thermoproteota archaeon]|nr:ribonuclease P protein subunit [Thermoproteota archaeon]